MIVAGDKAVGVSANHHADMARREERVDAVIRLIQQAAQGRNQRDVLAEKEEILDVLRLRLLQRNGGGRHGGFKAQTKEHHFARRILLRQLEGVHWRIDDTNIRAA